MCLKCFRKSISIKRIERVVRRLWIEDVEEKMKPTAVGAVHSHSGPPTEEDD